MAKLYAPEEYWILKAKSPETLESMVNGCGPAGWKSKCIPDTVWGVDIRVACDIHDFMYATGATEEDREQADRVFLNNMLRIVEEASANRLTRWIRRKRCVTYYEFVREMGGQFFWVDKNPVETFMDPALLAV